jgi:hopene-associated glycosyltransferase HpnB
MLTLLAVFSLLGWLYLLLLRGRFWLADQVLPAVPPLSAALPSVVALVPARNEETVIRRSLAGLMRQDYPGPFRILVIDDGSEDDTAAAIEATLAETKSAIPVTIVAAPPRPAGWTGKLAALKAGMEAATQNGQTPIYWWFTDADIAHGPGVLSRLVAAAVGSKREMVSQLARLDVSGPWARLLIPAFVFFFQKLYPFRWVNDTAHRTAAAAGGSLLVQNYALEAGGGLAAIRYKMIDDCAMARLVKNGRLRGHLWLGLADDSTSLRPNRDLKHMWEMVARTASEQLRHNPLWLALTLAMLALLYAVPLLALLSYPMHGHFLAALNGALAFVCMLVAYAPTLRRYGLPVWRGIELPFAAAMYGAMTIDSMLRHWRGRGGRWKGRTAPRSPRLRERLTRGDRTT